MLHEYALFMMFTCFRRLAQVVIHHPKTLVTAVWVTQKNDSRAKRNTFIYLSKCTERYNEMKSPLLSLIAQRSWVLPSDWSKVSMNYLLSSVSPFIRFTVECFVLNCLASCNIAEKKRFLSEESFRVCSRRVKLSVRKPFSAVITLISERKTRFGWLWDNKERRWHMLGWVRLARFNKEAEKKRTTGLFFSLSCHVAVELREMSILTTKADFLRPQDPSRLWLIHNRGKVWPCPLQLFTTALLKRGKICTNWVLYLVPGVRPFYIFMHSYLLYIIHF